MIRHGIIRQSFITLIAVLIVCSSALVARADVGIAINGSTVNVYPAPIMQNGRVFVPLRGVFENLGASVDYNNGQINATDNNTQISLTIGSTQATVNGSPVTIDVAPFIMGESTYVPLRFVSQALGANVSWDGTNQVVDITMGNVASAPDTAPPPIPYYQPPPVPQPNWIWTPGYWAWGPYGYYWVPGTWVQAPQVGLLWTPGYWSWQNGGYGWHNGYWATGVGYYGGINYGAGYYGNGFVGGNWSQNNFRYNTAVLPVSNTTIIKNVYVNTTVVVNITHITRVSYNGGPGGTSTRPTERQLAVASGRHVPMTQAQTQHVQVSSQDRALLSKVNGGKPPVLAAPRPFTPSAKPAGFVPVTPADRLAPARPVAPRPVVRHTVAPRPVVRHTVAPRPVVRHTIAPRPVVRHTVAPRPVVRHTVAPRPVVRHTVAPRPVVPHTPAPRPVVRHTVAPRPVVRHTVAPRPVVRHTAAPRPVVPHTPAPRPVVRHTVAPRPVVPHTAAPVHTHPMIPAKPKPAPHARPTPTPKPKPKPKPTPTPR